METIKFNSKEIVLDQRKAIKNLKKNGCPFGWQCEIAIRLELCDGICPNINWLGIFNHIEYTN